MVIGVVCADTDPAKNDGYLDRAHGRRRTSIYDDGRRRVWV
jgi:hypothetical protein